MLETLHRIVQEVNSAASLENALRLIVRRVKTAVHSDVCSVYLSDFDTKEHVLFATDGLDIDAVGKVRLPWYRGLVGLVCKRSEPINLDNATEHPDYLYITETGECRYRGFLGVPVMQNRQVLGVLVVRQIEQRHFDDSEVTFLFTLAAQLSGAIIHARTNGELAALQQNGTNLLVQFLQGRQGASGIALGKAVVVFPPADLEAVPMRHFDHSKEEEEAVFLEAVAAVQDDLKNLKARSRHKLAEEDLALFDAWLMMLSGDSLITRTIEQIHQGWWAPSALSKTVHEHAQAFDAMDDPYLRERASDIRDLGRRILSYLQSENAGIQSFPEQTILVGDEISAIQLAEVPTEQLVGVVSATGTNSSHLAILARAMGIPAIMGVTDLPVNQMHDCDLIIDGYRGRVYISPTPSIWQEYQRLADEDQALSNKLQMLRGLPSQTTDGIHVPLYLNTGLVPEAEIDALALEEAEGVGLYRTELPFMIRDRFPSESLQAENYRRILETFAPRPVILRTLDIGGDKPLPYFPVEETNPFLGWRGIRISLAHTEIFMTQLRAMLRAATELHNLQLLLPMVSMVDEVDESLALIQRAYNELLDEGYPVTMPKVGVMIEVPAAAFQMDTLAQRVDFFSIGTNDLTQYLLAVDRNNSRVADLYQDMHPAVLKILAQIVQNSKMYNRPVSVCGEMASNPAAAILLLGMGVSGLSMSAGSLLRIKWVIRSFSRTQARQLLQTALSYEKADDVQELLWNALDQAGLGGLMRPGK